MKKNLYALLLASLLAFSLPSCAKKDNKGSSNSGSETSSSEHVHQYDEHGVCPEDGAYEGISKKATEEDPIVLNNLVAGKEYFVRAEIEKGKTNMFHFQGDLKPDSDKCRFWERVGNSWNDISQHMSYDFSSESDGYMYVRYVSTEDANEVKLWTSLHEHTVTSSVYGFCEECYEYAGQTFKLGEQIAIDPLEPNKTYFMRFTGLDKQGRYKLNIERGFKDANEKLFTWGANGRSGFEEVDLINNDAPLGFDSLYISYSVYFEDNSVTISLANLEVDAVGYRLSDGEYLGEELTNDALLTLKTVEQGKSYYRIEVSPGDLYTFTMGAELANRSFDDEIQFYTRKEGVNTNIKQLIDVAFIMPEAPDGYLYISIDIDEDYTAPYFGLKDMNSNMGITDDGFFVGYSLKPGSHYLPAMREGQMFFYKFDVYLDHTYRLNNISDFSIDDFHFYGHNKNSEQYDSISYSDGISIESSSPYDYVILKLIPTKECDGSFGFTISHGGHLNSVNVCTYDHIFVGSTLRNGSSLWFSLSLGDKDFYRFKVEEGKEYTFTPNLTDNNAITYYSCVDTNYVPFSWDGSKRKLSSEDGYVYIIVYAETQAISGTIKLEVSDIQ